MQPSSSSILVKSLVATDHCTTLLFGQLGGGLTRAPADAGGTCMLQLCNVVILLNNRFAYTFSCFTSRKHVERRSESHRPPQRHFSRPKNCTGDLTNLHSGRLFSCLFSAVVACAVSHTGTRSAITALVELRASLSFCNREL